MVVFSGKMLCPICLSAVHQLFMKDLRENKDFHYWTIPEKIQTGELRIWNFQGYQRNSLWNFQGLLIKNEVEFPRATKKK